MLNIIDAVIILFLLMGAVLGFKAGVIKSGVALAGTIVVLILSYILKNPISTFMYTYFPFFNFTGTFTGVTVMNILLYEGISFMIIFGLLMSILGILIKITGIIEKILKFTIVLSIPSKILGAILGFAEAFIVIFVCLYVISQFSFFTIVSADSKYMPQILQNTPILSKGVEKGFNSVNEIYSLKDKYESSTDKNAYNMEALDILLKHEVLSVKSARKLVEKNKIPNSASNIIDKYEVNK